MTPSRTAVAALALLAIASTAAHAQQWGGSPPATSATASATTRTPRQPRVRATPVVDPNAYAFVFGARATELSTASGGGSWDGRAVFWGGSPPPAAAQAATGSPVWSGTAQPARGAASTAPPPAWVAPPAQSLASRYLKERGKP